ncbi:MAG: hypothetical protein LBR70_00270 [Lactobacillaceae bacterium]|jgi:hypothetical protein|nr:hypothetical protein [Lactobacillaceae bacterium]
MKKIVFVAAIAVAVSAIIILAVNKKNEHVKFDIEAYTKDLVKVTVSAEVSFPLFADKAMSRSSLEEQVDLMKIIFAGSTMVTLTQNRCIDLDVEELKEKIAEEFHARYEFKSKLKIHNLEVELPEAFQKAVEEAKGVFRTDFRTMYSKDHAPFEFGVDFITRDKKVSGNEKAAIPHLVTRILSDYTYQEIFEDYEWSGKLHDELGLLLRERGIIVTSVHVKEIDGVELR